MLERRIGRVGSLLDLGCATGVFVGYASGKGWRAVGVEPSEWAAQRGRERGLEILTGTLESVTLRPESFDVIHANHVIEHVEDPVQTIKLAARLLVVGGVFVAEVPHEIATPFAELCLSALGVNAHRPDCTYHLTFFSQSGLRTAVAKAGLTVEELRGQRRESLGAQDQLPLIKRIPLDGLYLVEAWSSWPNAIVVVARKDGASRNAPA